MYSRPNIRTSWLNLVVRLFYATRTSRLPLLIFLGEKLFALYLMKASTSSTSQTLFHIHLLEFDARPEKSK